MLQAFRQATAARGRSALTWNGDRAFVARASGRDQARPRLDTLSYPIGHDGSLPVLSAVDLAGESLNRSRLSTVLADGAYEMLLEELPNAPREELARAIGWRIRDRIDMPLEEAVIELLDMPAQARAPGSQSAYAVVTRRENVEAHVARVSSCGLHLDTIDLPELCMRNIALRLPQDPEGVAFLHFTDEHGLLTVTRQGVLYLVRRLDIGQTQLDASPATQVDTTLIPSICLELQRSLDYYETHYDLPAIGELVLGPGSAVAGLADAIVEQLGLTVSRLDLNAMFDFGSDLDENDLRDALFAIGAVLRDDQPAGKDA